MTNGLATGAGDEKMLDHDPLVLLEHLNLRRVAAACLQHGLGKTSHYLGRSNSNTTPLEIGGLSNTCSVLSCSLHFPSCCGAKLASDLRNLRTQREDD